MGWGDIQNNWDGQKRRVRERWSRLAEHELEEMGGHRDRLVNKIQDVYGIDRSEADSQVCEFELQMPADRVGRAERTSRFQDDLESRGDGHDEAWIAQGFVPG